MAVVSGANSQPRPALATPTVAYRRNGKLFSCEPCRKGKLRCDHASPTCGRCTRRGKADQCIYHPAPLTKQRPAENALERRTSAQVVAHKTAQHSQVSNGLVSPSVSARTTSITPVSESLGMTHPLPHNVVPVDYGTHSSGNDRHIALISPSAGPEACTSYRDSRHGFMGPTHYSTVFTEASAAATFDDDEDDGHELSPVPADKIELGAEVLSILRDMPVFRRFTGLRLDAYDGLVILQPAFKIWYDDFWDEFGPLLTEGDPTNLRRLSELIWRNTRRPFKMHGSMTAVQWAQAATGRDMRWEIVGIILSLIAFTSMNLNEWEAIFDEIDASTVDRATFAERMRKLSERCLCFCYECEVLNDVYLSFMYQDLILVECLKGEAHYIAWQRSGEMLDALVAMGLHQGNPVDSETPFFLAEMRKKLFVACYSRDKEMATFLGRPPRLSYRYCKLDMPLDLTDKELFLEGAELQAALSRLDAGGWNTSGKLQRRTWSRAWFQECLVREEILELALGSDDVDLDERARQLRTKLDRMHASLPSFLQITPEEAVAPGGSIWSAIGGGSAYADRMVRQCNALYVLYLNNNRMITDFLLERAVVNRSKGDTRALIPISRKILNTVLLAESKREMFCDGRGDMVYMFASHGLPCAGVLAIELLKQEQNPRYAPDLLPKSEIVQSLSVFISALASVSPGEGNYVICNQGRRALTKVLDQILAPSAPPATSLGQPWDDASLFFPTGNDAEFLQWLDNMVWDKPFLPTASGT